jgi:hypothetical protein
MKVVDRLKHLHAFTTKIMYQLCTYIHFLFSYEVNFSLHLFDIIVAGCYY